MSYPPRPRTEGRALLQRRKLAYLRGTARDLVQHHRLERVTEIRTPGPIERADDPRMMREQVPAKAEVGVVVEPVYQWLLDGE